MIPVLVTSHGSLAKELLLAAEKINGPSPRLEALCLSWNESTEELDRKLREAVDRLDTGEGVLILTDMAGNTPCNLAAKIKSDHPVQVVTGVNLAMVLRIACFGPEGMSLLELAEWVVERGRRSIRIQGGEERGKG